MSDTILPLVLILATFILVYITVDYFIDDVLAFLTRQREKAALRREADRIRRGQADDQLFKEIERIQNDFE